MDTDVQTGLSLLGLVGLAATVFYARRAWSVSQRTLEVERRPWFFTEASRDELGGIVVSFRNRGRSPGLIRYVEIVRVNAHGLPEPLIPKDDPTFRVPYGAVAVPGETSQQFHASMIRTRVEENDLTWIVQHYIMGYVIFDDLWGERYVHGFCFVVRERDFRFAGTGMLPPFGTGFPHERYNYCRKYKVPPLTREERYRHLKQALASLCSALSPRNVGPK
jgi:hypothetical protein